MLTNITHRITKIRNGGQNMTDNNVRIVVDVPRELRTEVNIIAKRNGITVKKIVNDLLEEYVSENKE